MDGCERRPHRGSAPHQDALRRGIFRSRKRRNWRISERKSCIPARSCPPWKRGSPSLSRTPIFRMIPARRSCSKASAAGGQGHRLPERRHGADRGIRPHVSAYGFMERIFDILARHEVSVDLISTSEITVSMTIDERELPKEALEELKVFPK